SVFLTTQKTHCGCACGSALAMPPSWSEALELELCTTLPLVGLAGGAEGRVVLSIPITAALTFFLTTSWSDA
uniref:Uncharacterized protein n=1 Tax=Equus asinus TaxID=9793 RepID=A0A8C4MBB8_EQUAS